MRKARHLVSGLLSVMLIPLSLCGSAQAADIGDCQAIRDRLARYACYDSWDAATGTITESQSRRPQNNPDEAAEDDASLFGRVFNRDEDDAQPEEEADDPSFFGRIFNRDGEDEPEEQAPEVAEAGPESGGGVVGSFGRTSESSGARVRENEDGKTELVDTVVELEQLGQQRWLLTLDGGQQWRQMVGKRYNLKVGDEVRIYPTIWGSSYRLSVDRVGGFIQVERVD